MEARESSETASNRRSSRRSSPPPPGGPPPPIDTDSGGEVERVLDSPDALRQDHAEALRDLLERVAPEYDLKEHLDRPGKPSAWMEGTAAACALCVDPGPVLAAMLSTLDTAIDGAETAEVVSHD